MTYEQPRQRKTKREKLLAAEQVRVKKEKSTAMVSIVLCALLFAGLILNIFSIRIYEQTVLNWKVPVTLWLLSGIVFFPLTHRYLSRADDGWWPMQVLYSTLACGGISAYLLLALNFNYATGKERKVTAYVSSIGKLAKGRYGCANPYVIMEFNSTTKQLILPCGFEMDDYKWVELTLKSGLLGFDVIVERRLLTD